ncbi:uncharacterized protein LOC135953781, partial [Calliphora vicina]|uniref:uncharacterized protein LOC135953781 n=1 Tax=Calliphora vicina TaxID=7373 RepID=UPI00325ADB8C
IVKFQKFVKFLNPKTTLPSDRTVAGTALNDVCNVYFNHVKTHLQKCPKNVTLLTDMWSDNYKRLSYINIKIHYCIEFEIKIVTLKTEIFPRPHTALAVSEKMYDALVKFNLQQKDICAVTDGGSNIVAALKLKNINRFGCTAHILHRFLSHDLLHHERFSHINKIISKLKQIYRSLINLQISIQILT